MKELIIIGTGKNAAHWYLKKCQDLYKMHHENFENFPVNLINIPFEPINAILPDQMEKAGQMLLPHLKEIDERGAARFILANITLHEAIDLQPKIFTLNTPFISLRSIIKKHWYQKHQKAMILGTYYTMKSDYIPSLFDDFDVTFITPNKNDFEAIDQLRTTYFNAPDSKKANELFDQLKNNYPEVDCFIIACTEHALALEDHDDSLKCFNLPELQCWELIS